MGHGTKRHRAADSLRKIVYRESKMEAAGKWPDIPGNDHLLLEVSGPSELIFEFFIEEQLGVNLRVGVFSDAFETFQICSDVFLWLSQEKPRSLDEIQQ